MGHGRLDSILDSYSIPGIDFYPPNPSKNIGSNIPKNKEKGSAKECCYKTCLREGVQFRTATKITSVESAGKTR